MKRKLRIADCGLRIGIVCALAVCAWLGGVVYAQPADAAKDMAASNASTLRLETCETWTPMEAATPITARTAEGVTIKGNGTETCCGGWQIVYTGVRGGQTYRIRAHADYKGVDQPWDSLWAIVLWDRWEPKRAELKMTPWNFLRPTPGGGGGLDLEVVATAPPEATCMTIRYVFRWSPRGSSEWTTPKVEPVAAPDRKPVKICIINSTPQTAKRIKTERLSEGLGVSKDQADRIDLWGSLALAACARKPQLIVMPEVVLSGQTMVNATEIPGPVTRPFEKIAREHDVYIVLGMKEKKGDAFYNVAVLVGPEGPEGKVIGIYRKVHLATSEGLTGLSAGDSFPVFNTKIGRIGCLICMDTMFAESARMLALGGADIICLPIMGDLRADRWTPGNPKFSEDRWKSIMRTRAIDNQLTMAIARNDVQGSCVIDRKGEILGYNEGDQEITEATLPAQDGYLSWDGGDVREVTWMVRRPHLYRAFTEEFNLKALAGGAKER